MRIEPLIKRRRRRLFLWNYAENFSNKFRIDKHIKLQGKLSNAMKSA